MKAQIALEYLLVMMVASALLVGYLIAVLAVQERSQQDLERTQTERLAVQLQQEILIAAQVRDGYQRTFYLEEEIAGRSYDIISEPGHISIQGGQAASQKRTPPYNGTPTPGYNTITRLDGEVRFI